MSISSFTKKEGVFTPSRKRSGRRVRWKEEEEVVVVVVLKEEEK